MRARFTLRRNSLTSFLPQGVYPASGGIMRSPLLLASVLLLMGCTKEVTNYVHEKAGAEAAKSIPSYAIHTSDATAEQCAAGGKVYEVYLDDNENQSRDLEEIAVSTQVVCNGTNGSNGANGADGADAPVSAYAPAEVIVPCGNTGSFSEVLLRLHNGQILVSFSDNTQGAMTRLVLLPDGTYMTTDNTGCQFSLATEGSTRSISWGGEVRSSWSVSQ